MANSGPHTVGSQFYITYSSCKHLDKKHSVFGAMVGGNAALSAIEAIATDKQDKPSRDVTLIRAVVLQNPIEEMEVSDFCCIFTAISLHFSQLFLLRFRNYFDCDFHHVFKSVKVLQ
jgi:Cyclophilin type peptidyl-prolyl cis-trans isomerase/CLD